MDVEIFESGKKELRIEKYPDTCGRGLSDTITAACNNSRIIVEWLNHVMHRDLLHFWQCFGPSGSVI